MHSRNEGRGIWQDWAITEVVVGQSRRDVHSVHPGRRRIPIQLIVTTATWRSRESGSHLYGSTRHETKGITCRSRVHEVCAMR